MQRVAVGQNFIALGDVQLLAVGCAVVVDVAVLVPGLQADGVDDHLAVRVMADRFAEPRGLHHLRMLVGEVDAAHHVVALPDHPHLFRRLDEIEGLGGIEQLSGDAAGIAPGLGGEGNRPLATEHLFIRREHLRGGPGL